MENLQKLQWSALEYEDKERSRDWFWALGVIILTAGAASIIFGNYFFAILIIIAGVLLGFFAVKKPNMVDYELDDSGLKVGTRIYPYENIKSFWVQTEPISVLFVKSERVFMPMLSIPLPDNMEREVHDIFTFKNIPEEEMKEHISDKIMDSLGF